MCSHAVKIGGSYTQYKQNRLPVQANRFVLMVDLRMDRV